MPNSRCTVSWPVEASDDLLIPAYARPDHVCKLDADHVNMNDREPADAQLVLVHRCHCGEQLPVSEAGR